MAGVQESLAKTQWCIYDPYLGIYLVDWPVHVFLSHVCLAGTLKLVSRGQDRR